ncbi:MAG TPA: glycosyltransferase family 4 protein [Thermoanaerobaculia bacterium]|jgi:glycosyltransferase involved in cell wall biosynthesis
MPKVTLCLVFPHVVLGGGETAMMEVAEGLREAVDLDVCALDQMETEGVATIRGELAERFGRAAFLRERWELRPRLRAADVVLWYGVSNAVPKALSAYVRRPGSIRVVHTDRAVDGPGFARRWRRVIDALVCVSPAVARRIPGACFIPNTCSLARLVGPQREFFPAEPARKTLGWAGRLVPLKNVSWLIDHVEEIGCNLLLQALDTPLLTVADLMRRAGERVRFLPPGRDLGTLLRSVDALAVVSRHEGFPVVVVEAGRLGVPVISTRVGALPELFADEILFVDGVDGAEGVPDAPSLRRALAAAGPAWGERLRAKVGALCDRDAVVARYLDLIDRVHRERRRDAA